MTKKEQLAKDLIKTLNEQGIRNYYEQMKLKRDNEKKMGRSTRLSQMRMEAAILALALKSIK